MTDSYFPLYPYDSDPLRILAPRNSRPAGAQECSSGPAMAEEAPGDGPEPASDAVAGAGPPGPAPAADPPPTGEGDHLQGGGGAPAGGPDLNGSEQPDVPLHQGSAFGSASQPHGSPPRAGEQPECDPVVRQVVDWMNSHWDTVKAMACAGEAPVRPPPPPAPVARADLPPVHVRKGDRWNKWKMAEFLRQLAATHSVSAAARAVGMNRRSAYRLRNRLKGQPFDIAWEAAFRHGYDELAHAALELALEGEEVPHYYQGELKGTHRKRHPQLMIGLLKLTNREGAPLLGRYNAAAEYWSENWDQLVQRIETGSVTWADERQALGEAELARLECDEKQEVDRIIARNAPDMPKRRG